MFHWLLAKKVNARKLTLHQIVKVIVI